MVLERGEKGALRAGRVGDRRTPSSGLSMSNREQVNSLQGAREVSQEAKEERQPRR